MVVFFAGVFGSLGFHGWLVGKEVYRQQSEYNADGIGESSPAHTWRVDACNNAQAPKVQEKSGSYSNGAEPMALLEYCADVRANELASSAGYLTGLATLFSLMSMLFAALALVIAVRVDRKAINRSTP
ncbi:MAG TPA: hypothetical protein VF759_13780 [Allosphingosinicella sp.]